MQEMQMSLGGYLLCRCIRPAGAEGEIRMTEIIVAVEGISHQQAKEKGILSLLSRAKEQKLIWGVKVNDMLYSGDVSQILSSLHNDYGLGIMADVKLHDIPSTMENSIATLVGAGADIVTIHCSSNFRPRNEDTLKHLAGVTALTSFTDLEVKWIYDKSTEEIVRAFSDIALMNHYEYIVSSIKDLNFIQGNPLKKICTGIRPSWYPDRHDQVRVSSIKEAIRMEADFIVLGRPIMYQEDMWGAIERVFAEVQ
jgi:orotidine-5'-phosphate decarboxylase